MISLGNIDLLATVLLWPNVIEVIVRRVQLEPATSQ